MGLNSLTKCQVLETSALEILWACFCTELYFVLTFIPLFVAQPLLGNCLQWGYSCHNAAHFYYVFVIVAES